MSKSAKIKKTNSFMFTTKHHSFSGVMGCLLCVISISVLSYGIYTAYLDAGKSNVRIGGAALFALILDFIGIIAGVTGSSERDIHKWGPIVSIVANAIILVCWVLLVLMGNK